MKNECHSELGDYCKIYQSDCKYADSNKPSCPYFQRQLTRPRVTEVLPKHDRATIGNIDCGLSMRIEWSSETGERLRI